MEPASVLKLKVDDMRAAGLSARKVEYLVDLALHFDNGRHPRPRRLAVHGRRAIIAELVASAASAAGRPRCSSSST
jgi:DNA-3-methyladenine glycosylase II